MRFAVTATSYFRSNTSMFFDSMSLELRALGAMKVLNLVRKALRLLREKGFREFVRALIACLDDKTGLISFLLLPYIIYKSKRLGLRELLEELFNESSILSILFRPMQVSWEMEKLLEVLKDLEPRYILEIGTAKGGTLFLWTRVASQDALIISIDLPGGAFGGGYPFLKGLTYKFFARKRQRIVLIRGDSHSVETFKKVRKVLGEAKLDFLFIDGDHSYEGVKKDFEMYFPLVQRGGVVALHDIVPGREELVGGVPRFWGELKRQTVSRDSYISVMEFVKDWNQGGYGIGIIIKES